MRTARAPLAVEALVSDHHRRESAALDMDTVAKKSITVKDHEQFRDSISSRPVETGDEIDELVEELREMESRRKANFLP